MKLIQTVMDCIRRYGSRREADKREADDFWSDLEPEEERALEITQSAAFELGLYRERAWDRERSKRQIGRSKTIEDLPVLGGIYKGPLSAAGVNPKLTGFVLFNDGIIYEVRFEEELNPLSSLRHVPKSMSYDEAMSRIPERDRYYFEGRAINYLRQVLHIRGSEDPILDTSFRNLSTTLEIFNPSSVTISRYQPLSGDDRGLVVGLLNSVFSQMRQGRQF